MQRWVASGFVARGIAGGADLRAMGRHALRRLRACNAAWQGRGGLARERGRVIVEKRFTREKYVSSKVTADGDVS